MEARRVCDILFQGSDIQAALKAIADFFKPTNPDFVSKLTGESLSSDAVYKVKDDFTKFL